MLINDSYLKKKTYVSIQKDSNDLKVAIERVAEIYIIDLLSIPLYELLLDHTTNDTVLNDKQSKLLDKVKFYYALMVEHELMGNIFTISNKGNQEANNTPNREDVVSRRSEVMLKAEKIKSDILTFLNDNRIDFPQYYTNSQNTESSNDFIVFYDTKN
jgi:hypothetical protein